MFRQIKSKSGFSLIEVIVVIAVVTIVFGGLFVAFEHSVKLISHSKAKMTALSLMTDRMESIRALPYDQVGTVAGIPSGAVPQNRIVNLNGLDFSERVLIEFVDDPADGVGGADSNGVLSDYKKIKIEYTWTIAGVPSSFSMSSVIVPRSIETTAGGGTLRVNVFNASASPLQGMSVRLINNTTAPTIDITRFTDASGAALFTGAPAASEYQIFVSSPGYSSDQTRQATTSLPNPNTLPVAVLESDVSTMNFQIDRLSTTTLKFYSSKTVNDVAELFDDMSGISSSTSVVINSGALELFQSAGVYDSSGQAWLNAVTPATIDNWGMVTVDSTLVANTDLRVQFYTSTNTADIIPDAVLPGNSLGFASKYIDLRSLNGTLYPTLVPRLSLYTSNTTVTPMIMELEISYVESQVPLVGEPIDIIGNKTIGTLADATPVPKYSISTTTNAFGIVSLYGIEWDLYRINMTGGPVVREACAANPFTVSPNSSTTVSITASPSTANNLRVVVKNGAGEQIIGSTVTLTRPAYSSTMTTGWCGQVFYSGLVNSADYDLNVSAPGYSTSTLDPFSVAGNTVQEIILAP